jgi:hypothetical protein
MCHACKLAKLKLSLKCQSTRVITTRVITTLGEPTDNGHRADVWVVPRTIDYEKISQLRDKPGFKADFHMFECNATQLRTHSCNKNKR